MNNKIKIRKFSDYWGQYECSSNRNLPENVVWLPGHTKEEYDFTIYVDGHIMTYGLRDKSIDKIGWLLESPIVNENVISNILKNFETIKKEFKYIFTCVDRLLEMGEPFTYCFPSAVAWIWKSNRNISPKNKLVSMIASTKSQFKGHRHRLEWVEKLKDKVDLFGTGRPNYLLDKEDGIRDYMFSVTIENDDTDGYFSEKITDNFVMGTVPVYWGSKKTISRYFDEKGIIFLEDDPTLETLSEKKYYEMMPHIKKNYEIAINLPISEDYIYKNYLKI